MFHIKFFRKSMLATALWLMAALTAGAESLQDLPVKTIGGKDYYYYEVVPKDTPFRLSQRFSISIDDITKYNPAVKDGLKAYSTLHFPVNVFGPQASAVNRQQDPSDFDEITIQHGQTLFSIAESHGTTVDAILAANPGLQRNNYQAGRTIKVPSSTAVQSQPQPAAEITPGVATPVPATAEPERTPSPETAPVVPTKDDMAAGNIPQPTTTPSETVPTLRVEESEMEPDTISIALMLPLEADSQQQSRVAQLYMDFYRGFLIGLEEKSSVGLPVKVSVYDTSDAAAFDAALGSGELENFDLFIGPDKEQQLTALAEIANRTDAFILNPFVIKEELVHANPSIVQTNIPRNEMYAGAIDKFLEMHPSTTTVFLARVDGEADKVPFTDQLREKLDEADRPYKKIVYQGVLTDDDLTQLESGNSYVFVPVSASRNEFGKFISGVKEFKLRTESAGGEVSIFGYPEWTTLRGEQLGQLHELNASIYSRFVNREDHRVYNVNQRYKKWYGGDWSDVEPNQALLGYDTAIFAIDNLRRGDGNLFPAAAAPFNGVQSSMVLGKPFEEAGYINGAMYMIKYRPGRAIDARVVAVPVNIKLAQ